MKDKLNRVRHNSCSVCVERCITRFAAPSRGIACSGSAATQPSSRSIFTPIGPVPQDHVESDDPTDYKEDPEDPSSEVGTAVPAQSTLSVHQHNGLPFAAYKTCADVRP